MSEEEVKNDNNDSKKKWLLLLLLLFLIIFIIWGIVVFLKDDGTAQALDDETVSNEIVQSEDSKDKSEDDKKVDDKKDSSDTAKPVATIKTATQEVVVAAAGTSSSAGAANTSTVQKEIVKVNIEDDSYFSEPVVIEIAGNEYTATITDSKGNVVTYNGKTTITEEGTYTLTIKETDGKETSVVFVVDTTAPVIEGVEEKLYNTEVSPKVTEVNLDVISLTKDGTQVKYTLGNAITEDGEYVLKITDKAGNDASVEFSIDRTAPTYTVNYSAENATNKDVVVTITASENIYGHTGWEKSGNDATITKTYTENTEETVTFTDEAGNKVTVNVKVANIDKVAPALTVKKNITSMTKKSVTVRVTADEQIQLPDNTWSYDDDTKLVIKKVYRQNIEEDVIVKDLVGNEATAHVKITNIDKVAPIGSVTTSNDNGNKVTNQDVTATLIVNEPIKALDGWTKVDEYTYTKVYSSNQKVSFEIEDIAGNKTTISFEIKGIDKGAPTAINIEYSPEELTNGNVVVTITASEPLYGHSGWEKAGRAYKIKKTFTENGEETVILKDKAGNETPVTVKVTNIDRVAPTLTVKSESVGTEPYYSNISFSISDDRLIDKFYVNGYEFDRDNAQYSDANYANIKHALKEGENTITLYDVAGNTSSKTFIIDWTKPVVTERNRLGKEPHYRGMSFGLSDNNMIDKFTLNGVMFDRANNKFSDANYVNIKHALKDGENTLVLYDIAGNTTEHKFSLDLVAPTLTVRDTVGNNPYYSQIGFGLSDDHLVDKFTVNGVEVDRDDNKYSDANYANIKHLLKEGENTITLYDTAGNTSSKTFIIDWTKPVVTERDRLGKEPHYRGMSFGLSDNNMVDKFTLNSVMFDRANNKYSDANYVNIKHALKDGENTLVLYDIAGNKTEHKFTLDLVAPNLTIRDAVGTDPYYSQISFGLSDNHLVDKITVNGTELDRADNKFSDANFGNIRHLLKEGENTITVYDTAGNSKSKTFIIDWTAPMITVKGFLDLNTGDMGERLTSNEDVVIVNEPGLISENGSLREYKVQYNLYNPTHETYHYTLVVVRDRAGNETTMIDTDGDGGIFVPDYATSILSSAPMRMVKSARPVTSAAPTETTVQSTETVVTTTETTIETTSVVEEKVEDTPASTTPVVEEKVEDTPAPTTPVVEEKVEDTSAPTTPVVEEKVEDTPAPTTSVVEEKVEETPIVTEQVVETPVVEIPVVETPVIETSVVPETVVETPVTEVPVVTE